MEHYLIKHPIDNFLYAIRFLNKITIENNEKFVGQVSGFEYNE